MAKGNSDLELLIRMMGQTGSDNDNVVLVAIKKANEQVRKLAGSWDELLRGHFTIAADPFEGLTTINLDRPGDISFSDPQWRRGVAPAPPPPQRPAPPPPPPPPRPAAAPQPGPSSSASGPMGNGSGKARTYNRFRAVCFKCGHTCDPGQGYLDSKTITGQWKVACVRDSVCQANLAKKRPRGAKSSLDNLTNMLD